MIAMPADWVWAFVSMAALLLGIVLLGIAWIVWCMLGSNYQANPARTTRTEEHKRLP